MNKVYQIKNQSWISDKYYNDLIKLVNSGLFPFEFIEYCKKNSVDLENLNEVIIQYSDNDDTNINLGYIDDKPNKLIKEKIFIGKFFKVSIKSKIDNGGRVLIVFEPLGRTFDIKNL